MKQIKRILCLLLSAITITLSASISVFANEEVHVILDGELMSFDVPAQIINDRTMVPMRTIFEKLGAYVDWNEDTQTITASNGTTTFVTSIGSNTFYVNGSHLEADTAPCIVDGRTLVPVRFVSEAFGCMVAWMEQDRLVMIFTSEEERLEMLSKYDTASAFLQSVQSMYHNLATAMSLLAENYSNDGIYNAVITEAQQYLAYAISDCNDIISKGYDEEITTKFTRVLELLNTISSLVMILPEDPSNVNTPNSILNAGNEISVLTNSIDHNLIFFGYSL